MSTILWLWVCDVNQTLLYEFIRFVNAAAFQVVRPTIWADVLKVSYVPSSLRGCPIGKLLGFGSAGN